MDRFEHEVRKITKKVGVDVVFEHVGADTWQGSLLSMKPGARLVTCGSTSGVSTTMNLMQLFQRQYKIFGSFGATIRNVADGLNKMGRGIKPVIDTVVPLEHTTKAWSGWKAAGCSARSWLSSERPRTDGEKRVYPAKRLWRGSFI